MVMDNSQINQISTLTFVENKECLYASRSNITSMENSNFMKCGTIDTSYGGAIRLINSNIQSTRSQFIENTAKVGASISIEWDIASVCSNSFSNLEFANNSATQMGGGIYYNLNRPSLQNITYSNNSAMYGPDIASYAVKIVQRGTQDNKIYLDNIPSGLKYNQTLYFDLVDYDGQVMSLENATSVKVLIDDLRISIKGTDSSRLTNGQAELDNLIFVGEVGLQNTTYKLTSKSIDSTIINQVLENSDGKYDNYVDVSFR